MTFVLTLLPLLVLGVLVLPLLRSPQVTVTVGDGLVRVHLGLSDKMYCFRGDLCLPVGAVEGVAVWPREQLPTTGLRLPGTSLRGVIRAGSYGLGDARDFWDVRKGQRLLVLHLRPGAGYRRVILEVGDADAAARALQPLLGAYTGSLGQQ